VSYLEFKVGRDRQYPLVLAPQSSRPCVLVNAATLAAAELTYLMRMSDRCGFQDRFASGRIGDLAGQRFDAAIGWELAPVNGDGSVGPIVADAEATHRGLEPTAVKQEGQHSRTASAFHTADVRRTGAYPATSFTVFLVRRPGARL
jgi:hypothetical protein